MLLRKEHTITIDAGTSLTFRATNIETGNCSNLIIQDIDISNTLDFDISPNNPSDKIKPSSCSGDKYLDFEIENDSGSCSTTHTTVTVEIKNQSDFTFTLEVNSSPEIYVLGGSPYTDIYHNDVTTSDANGTNFGIVSEGDVVVRYYIVANIGSCGLNVFSASSSNPDYVVFYPYTIPVTLQSYYYTIIGVRFTAPISPNPLVPISGTQRATISIFNSDNTEFKFDVTAEMFDFTGPQPGGITADFRLWLKGTRGVFTGASGSYVAASNGNKVSLWEDIGTNSKDATQDVVTNQPTYINTVTENINFNPVIKFENNGSSIEQYLKNDINGFYSQDIFIVMVPDAPMSSSSNRTTILAGIDSGGGGDLTGVGFGNYSDEFTGETLSYNQDIPGSVNYHGTAEIGTSIYSNAGIINVRNNSTVTAQEILYNSHELTTSTEGSSFANINSGSGSKYWIGRNFDFQGSLNGRIAEIFTFASTLSSGDRQKVESYLAIKYGITLGASNEAQRDYVNSFNNTVWDISANLELSDNFNHDVAGIGRDDNSDLNQKQSKTINSANGVTIGLGGVFGTNIANPNEFEDDGDFLVWGNNNGAYSESSVENVTIVPGITTSFTRMDRKWKIVESTIAGDVETVCVGIPVTAFSGFSIKNDNEEYVLIVADNPAFGSADIVDIVPLQINVDEFGDPIEDNNGYQVYKAWYDFHDTNYFTFGKVSRLY